MSKQYELTGRTRYKVKTSFLRRQHLVLQVEERVSWERFGEGFTLKKYFYLRWRYAKPEDIMVDA